MNKFNLEIEVLGWFKTQIEKHYRVLNKVVNVRFEVHQTNKKYTPILVLIFNHPQEINSIDFGLLVYTLECLKGGFNFIDNVLNEGATWSANELFSKPFEKYENYTREEIINYYRINSKLVAN